MRDFFTEKQSNDLAVTTFIIAALVFSLSLIVSKVFNTEDVKNTEPVHATGTLIETQNVTDNSFSNNGYDEIEAVIVPSETCSIVGHEQTAALTENNVHATHLDDKIPNSFRLDVKPILQLPELPTGCEITSLTKVLNYYGYDVSKTQMAQEYLIKGVYGSTDLNDAFISDPFSEQSYGCYAPVIEGSANIYFKDNSSFHEAVNITGSSMNDIYRMVSEGIPVIVWSTIALEKPEESYLWDLSNGEEVYFMKNEHCVVVIGYNIDRNIVIVADPLYGIVNYQMDKFEKRYIQMGSQAVYIKTSEG